MFGIVENNVENVKVIGRREMNMDSNMKRLFYETDDYRYKPYFNDAKELFGTWFWFCIFGKRLIINRNKFDWETFNTSKIKTIFNYEDWAENDYGSKLRFKCHQRIQRKDKTIDGDLCINWELIDSFGVDLNGSIHHTDGYEKFYDDPGSWRNQGNGLW